MTIAPHLFPELVVHVLCSIPNASWIEHMGLLDDLWVEALPVRDGMVSAPERPGHGLAFEPEVLAKFSRMGNA
jgi:L-alanine-DL-glutamate epimerase-like enolase superfamily enzyme